MTVGTAVMLNASQTTIAPDSFAQPKTPAPIATVASSSQPQQCKSPLNPLWNSKGSSEPPRPLNKVEQVLALRLVEAGFTGKVQQLDMEVQTFVKEKVVPWRGGIYSAIEDYVLFQCCKRAHVSGPG
jgi:hypothetical protein